VPEPNFFNPSFEGAWNSDIKRYRAKLPGVNAYVFFNVGIPGYVSNDGNFGIPTTDGTEYIAAVDNASDSFYQNQGSRTYDVFRTITSTTPRFSNQDRRSNFLLTD
ncbi:hypothetical protein, partial [Tritonibacter sp. SIMBA_163]|uniref:hypothetical protein n=1 Tax=Tritonibacter sp. SIMBA_163 TaxID=3080868 RepID=UPI00397F798B